MLNAFIRLLLTAIIVMLIAYLLDGVHVDGFGTAVLVAIVLALLNLFVKPILNIFTLPLTIITLGLFSLVINAIVILICDYIVGGFDIASFFTAFLFSIILSISQSLVFLFVKD